MGDGKIADEVISTEIDEEQVLNPNDETEEKTKTGVSELLYKYSKPWFEIPKVTIKSYLPRGLRHLFFGLFPTILDIVTDMMLFNQYLNGNIYTVNKKSLERSFNDSDLGNQSIRYLIL